VNIYEKLLNIQAELRAPKNQYNSFGKYNYRSCEDILEGLKPLLTKYKATLIIDDEIVQIGDRYYVKATATLIDVEGEGSLQKGRECISSTSFAREDEKKTGMDLSQLTGSTSSYARKYALNGLFCIDDTKDSDATNEHKGEQPKQDKKAKQETKKETNQDENKQAIEDNSLASEKASEKQLNLIYKLVKEKNYSSESMAKYISEAFGKKSSKELTKKEASELIKMLNEMKG